MGKYGKLFLLFSILFSFLVGCDRSNPEPENVIKFDKEVLAHISFDEPVSLNKFNSWVEENQKNIEISRIKFVFEDILDMGFGFGSNEDMIVGINYELSFDIDELGKAEGVVYVDVWTSKKFFYEELIYGKGFFAERVDNVDYTEIETPEDQPVLVSWIPRYMEMKDEILLVLYFDEYNDFQGFPYLDIVVEIDQPFSEKFLGSWISNLPGAYYVYDPKEENANKFRLRVNTREIQKDEFVYVLHITLENNEDPMNINSMSVTFDLVSGGSCRVKDGETVCSYDIKHSGFLASSSRSLKHGGEKRLPDIKYLF